MSAQSTGNAPAQAPRAASPAPAPMATSSKPETPTQPAITFEDVLRTVETTGRPATIRRDIAEDLGLIYNSDMPPVEAHALEDPKTSQEIYLTDDTHAILLMIKEGDIVTLFLANRAGKLQVAGQVITHGRFRVRTFETVSLTKAAAGYEAEKTFWMQNIRKIADQYKYKEDAAAPAQAAGKPE